jgi:hypothetical protein
MEGAGRCLLRRAGGLLHGWLSLEQRALGWMIAGTRRAAQNKKAAHWRGSLADGV